MFLQVSFCEARSEVVKQRQEAPAALLQPSCSLLTPRLLYLQYLGQHLIKSVYES